jgi:hypothetical protein
VPFGLSSSAAPRGTIAWRRLISGIVIPRRAKRSWMRSTIDSSTSSGTSSARASESRVTSSSVGPSPPVATITSAHDSARRNKSATSLASSPATAFKRTSTPISFSRSVMNNELVSTRNGVSSSVPTAMMQAFIGSLDRVQLVSGSVN